MAWHPELRAVVLFGGSGGPLGDAWSWDGRAWSRLPTGPAARNHAVLVSAPDRGSLLLFGGHDGETVFGDLWEWRDGRWTLLQSVPAERRVANGH